MLWVFSLLTSGDNPGFVDQSTGRKGLEPIQPSQGGDIAWSLNLHHPYNAANPIDSLQVAARAINNIISGATLTSASGGALVEPGLESKAANCQRYTGSAKLLSRSGYPARCAAPLTSAGAAAMVSDVFQQWMGGTPSRIAQQAGRAVPERRQPGRPAGAGDPQQPARVRRLARERPAGRATTARRQARTRKPGNRCILRAAKRTVTAEGGKCSRAFRQEAMVATGNGACDRDDWRRDNRAQLRPRGGHDDDLADQRATPPARPGAGGAAWHVHRPGGRRGHLVPGDERRAAAGGDRERGRVLPAARQDQDACPDGVTDLGQHQHQRRRPR